MTRHIVVFIYILGIFSGLTGILLNWLLSKKASHNEVHFTMLRRFLISTFLIGLISFFTFYSQYIIFLQPSNTAVRLLDYLFWACFIMYWIDYLDSLVEDRLLPKLKLIIQYGCLCYIFIWLFATSYIWDVNFYIISQTGRILFVILDILFCILSVLVVVIYAFRGRRKIKNRFSSIYIFSISSALVAYAGWELTNYLRLFAGESIQTSSVLHPFNATAFFLFFTNLFTLIYIYYNDFSASYFAVEENILIRENADDINAAIKDNMINEDSAASRDNVTNEENTANDGNTDNEVGADVENNDSKTVSMSSGDIAAVYNLTPREKEVMEFVYKGFNNAEIADELFISQNTVKHHIYNLFKKLNVKSRIELICMLQEYYS